MKNLKKEQLIDLFKKSLNKAQDRTSLMEQQDIYGVKVTSNVGIIVTPSYEYNQDNFLLKVIFRDYVEYKSVEITKEECNELAKLYADTSSRVTLKEKNEIIKECESELISCLQE